MEYSRIVEVYEKLEGTTKRLEHTYIISEFLKNLKIDDLSPTILLLEGRIFPRWDNREMGIASKLMIKAISIASGETKERINKEWKKTGDLGTVAYNLIKRKKQHTLKSSELTVKKILKNLRTIVSIEGLGSVDKKNQLIAELLTSSNASEAKYIVRTVLNDMRIGVGEGTIRDAIIWAFFGKDIKIDYNKEENDINIEDRETYKKYVDALQKAYDITNNFGPVAETAKKNGIEGLKEIKMSIGMPLKVMLALKVDSIEEGFERCGKPAEFEYKYDGMRMQIHKNDNDIKIFTRRLEDITKQFPEVVAYIKKYVDGKKVVLDSEAVGYSKKTGKYLAFQNISKRIKRKYDIKKMSEDFPMEVNVFDIINYMDKSIINYSFEERKKILKKIIKNVPKKISLAKSIITSDKIKVQKFYNQAIDSGNEGLMIKKLDAPYKPGARVGFMCKLKSQQDPLDLVIIKAEWGEGKRYNWLSSYTLACVDNFGNFLEVGKASTGLKEKNEEGLSFSDMTKIIKPLIKKEEGKEVILKPEVVIEVGYEEIQKSPSYSSGYALRFPRILRLRTEDKKPEDATTLSMITRIYEKQKKK